VAKDGIHKIKYFSHRQRLHLWDIVLKEDICFKIFHLILYSMFLSFKLHINLLSSVALRLDECLKLDV